MASKRPTSIVNIAIRALDQTKKGFSSPIKNAQDLKAALGSLKPVGIAAGAAIAGAFTLAAKSLIDTRQELAEFSDRIGISIEELSRLKFAAEQSGVGFNELQTSLQRMTRRVGEGTKATSDALAQLGLTLEDLQGLSADEQFREITKGFDGIQDSGQRAAVAMKLFDTEGVKLLQMLGNGSAGLESMTQQADKLGLTISGNSARSVQKLNEILGVMKGTMMGLVNQFLEGFLPALNSLSQAGAGEGLVMINQLFRNIGQTVGWVLKWLASINDWFNTVLPNAVNLGLEKVRLMFLRTRDFILRLWSGIIVEIGNAFEYALNKAIQQINKVINSLPGFMKKSMGIDSGIAEIDFKLSDRASSVMSGLTQDTRETLNNIQAIDEELGRAILKSEQTRKALFAPPEIKAPNVPQAQGIKIPDAPTELPTTEAPNVPVTQDGLVTFRPIVFSETFEQFIERYKQVIFDINNIQIELFASMDRGMTDAFTSILDGSKSASKAFQDMGKQMLATLTQIIAKLIVANILTRAIGFLGFGGGNPIAGIQGGFEAPTLVAGIAHSGMTNIPKEGTYLLNKGERVIAPQQNEDLSQYLAGTQKAGMTEIQINLDGEILARSLENLVDRNVVNINASSVI